MSNHFLASHVECDHRDNHVHNAACAYRVVSTINPHMKVGAVDLRRARAQHRDFIAALRFCGARVEQVPFVHGCPDSVFMKDNALVVAGDSGRRALLARPRHAERIPEQEPRRHHLQHDHHIHVQTTATGMFEGGDVVVADRVAFLGIGERTSVAAAAGIARFLRREVVCLELIDEAFFHLDTCLGLLNDGTALVAEGALSSPSLATLRRHPAVTGVVMIPREDALQFGLNFVQIDKAVVLHRGARKTAAVLQSRGLTPVTVDLSEFLLAGGSAACLVARVHDDRVVVDTASAVAA